MKPLAFNISNDALNIIIGFSTLTIALISFGIEIGKYKTFKFVRKLAFRIPTLIVFSIIIIWSTVIKDKNNDIRNSNDVTLRDSINQKKFNESLSKATGSFASSTSKTLASYYLKYDSSQHKIEKIVTDTLNRPKGYSEIIPELNTSETEGVLLNDTLRLATKIAASQAAVYNIKYQRFYVVRKYNNDYSEANLNFIAGASTQIGHNKLTVDEPKGIIMELLNHDFATTKYVIYIYFKGTYESQYGKVYPFESLHFFQIWDKKNATLSDNEYKWIYHYIQKQIAIR